MDTRGQRVQALADWITEHPDRAAELSGPIVEEMYTRWGVEVSVRQARRDLGDARSLAADPPRSPALPHWSEDVTGKAIRITIGRVLVADREPTIPQLRQAVAAAHGRAIGDGELRQIARSVYSRLYTDPLVAEAEEALRDLPGSSWSAHRARIHTDPLNYPNPFGPDPEATRLQSLVWCRRLLVQLTGRGGNIPRSNANTVLNTLRLMRDLSADAPDTDGG